MLELFPALWLPTLLTAVGVVLAVVFLLRPRLAAPRGGAVLAVVAVLGLPAFLLWIGMDQHVHHAKETEFCLSCHAMLPYGESLTQAEEGVLAAVHFQNRYVPSDQACFTCHTAYTLYGGLQAKLSGVRHMWHAYVAGVPDPIQLYGEYKNRDCLHCHMGQPRFMEQPAHQGQIPAMQGEEISCLLCHGPVHGVEEGAVTAAIEGSRRFQRPESVGGGAR